MQPDTAFSFQLKTMSFHPSQPPNNQLFDLLTLLNVMLSLDFAVFGNGWQSDKYTYSLGWCVLLMGDGQLIFMYRDPAHKLLHVDR